MKPHVLLFPFILAAVGGAACPPSQPGPGPTPVPTPKPTPIKGFDCSARPQLRGIVPVSHAIAGKFIVVLKNKSRIQTLMSVEGVTEVKEINKGYAARLAAAAITKLLADPNVEYIQQDGVKSVNAVDWGLDRTDQRDLPLDGVYSPGSTGVGVNVAVIDTGISSHPDFASRLASECFTAHSGCADGHGHGTHVAGTIAGSSFGIAKAATLYAVRVLDSDGSGSDSDVIRGIEWVMNKKLADPSKDWAANMSLGGGPSPALDAAVCDALDAGVTFAIAAGNEGSDADTSSPARVRQAITVAASDSTDHEPDWSNYGSLVDLYAPGVDIRSDAPGGGTAVMSGTSMATPHVAGVAALVLERHHGAKPAEVANFIIGLASKDKIVAPKAGSPNLLLYSRGE